MIVANNNNEAKRELYYGAAKENSMISGNTEQTKLLNYYLDMEASESLNPDSNLLELGVNSDSEYEAYYDSMSSTNIRLMELIAEQVGNENYTTANTMLAGMLTHNVIEYYYKTVTSIFLDKEINNYEFYTTVDSITLNTIAHLNAYYNGPSVYLARAMLGLILLEPDMNLNNYRFEEEDIEPKQIQTINRWNIYPNPTNGNIVLSNTTNIQGTLFIYDVIGRLLFTELVSTGNYININKFAAGTYTIKIIDEFGVAYRNKIVLIK